MLLHFTKTGIAAGLLTLQLRDRVQINGLRRKKKITKKARQKKKLRQDVSNKRYSRDYWSEDADHGGTFIESHIKRT